MNELVVKEVNFNGDQLKAIQDSNRIIWVGISWICNGLGLNKNMKDRQIKNIQTDSLLKRGCVKFDAGVFDPNNETLALELDYLPAWLFKINITPKMKRETPEMVDKLVEYQLKAKDILAEAFLPKQYNQRQASITPVERFLDNNTAVLEAIRQDNLNFQKTMMQSFDNMSRFIQATLEYIKVIDKNNNYTHSIENNQFKEMTDEQKEKRSAWKQEEYRKIDYIIEMEDTFEERSHVLNYIYKIMRNNYGIVWEQDVKEYKEAYGITYKPNTIDVTYENDMYRDIFNSILNDMVVAAGRNKDIVTSWEEVHPNVLKLAERLNNRSKNGTSLYRKIFRLMDVDWDKYPDLKTMSKTKVVKQHDELQREFINILNQLIKEREER